MSLKLKTKFSLGLIFLFIMTLAISMQGIYQIYRLNGDVRLILRQNIRSIMFSNNMLLALETQPVQLDILKQNLLLQEQNVTEPGEGAATTRAASLVQQLRQQPGNAQLSGELRHVILQISGINQQAIIRKNDMSSAAASRAILTLSVSTLVLLSVSILFIFSYPHIITQPIHQLIAGIRQIADKKYNTRIHIRRRDEFGELAAVFNVMAEKLHEYENSNLEKIKMEKTRIETIINQMNDGIICYDTQQHILFMNEVVMRLCGPQANARAALLASIYEHPAHQELRIGSAVFIKEVISNAQGAVVVLRDVSAFEELAAAKTKFIATASHELKTPIAAMKMSISLLADERTGTLLQSQQELLESINDDVERILQISSELLDFTQMKVLSIPNLRN
ncbi:histidine kinase dimerization/phospho-acceptor domain-containing protein [Chitinophaga arvensicola]|nr:histidine kinase dimerization/phospho-acceptor domain-containing protein [Chitinophaga arvensicola]